MNRTKRNKPKKKKKNSPGKKKVSTFENHPGIIKKNPDKIPVEPTTSPIVGDSQVRVKPKKAKKRKHSTQVENAHAGGANGDDGIPKKKKKKVTWGENTSRIISETPDTVQSGHLKTDGASDSLTATDTFLSILALTDAAPERGPKVSDKNITESIKRAARRAKKLEKRARDKQAKALLKNSQAAKVKALESIEDRNIQNKKLKDKNVKVVGSQKKMDAKRPRLDENNAVDPTKKRTEKISPNRQVVAGYKFKDLSEKQQEAFLRLRDKKKYDKLSSPKLQLQNYANYSSMVLEDEDRTPMTLGDFQHFLIYSLHGHHSTGHLPTWIKLENSKRLDKRVCIVVDGVSLSDYVNNEDNLPNLKSFKYQLDVVTPYAYGGDFVTEFLHVPLTNNQRHKLVKKHGSCKEAYIAGEAFRTLERIYPQGTFLPRKMKSVPSEDKSAATTQQPPAAQSPATTQQTPAAQDSSFSFSDPNVVISPPSEDKFPRTELLLRSWDLIKERVPVPYAEGRVAQNYKGFVQTRDAYDEVTDQSPIWGLDCEMCMTKAGQELTRISVINENFEVVYETMVKPYNPIVNYLTQYSGITQRDLENVWTRIEDVHEDLRNLLPSDVILAGHSIGCDLLAMKMFHPYVIDTSCIFNLSGIRPQKTKLKTLMAELLYERIQEGGRHGHDSVEDAAACLKLIKAKLARSIEWGDAVLAGKRPESDSVFAQQMILKRDKEGRPPTIYPVAAKSIIRCGPRAHQTSVQPGSVDTDTQPRERRPERVYAKPAPALPPKGDNPFGKSIYSKPIISHLVARDFKNLLFAGDEKFVSAGEELVQSKFKAGLPESRLQFSVQRNCDVLVYGCENAPSNGMSLLRLSPDEEPDSKTRILQADKLIGKALKKLTLFNSLVTVLLTGRQSGDENDTDLYANHGIFMMKVLKPGYVPLTIEDLSETCS